VIPKAQAFFKRVSGSIDGVLTLNVAGMEVVKRHPCRTGQRSAIGDPWKRGAGPIPLGNLWLWLDPIDNGPDLPNTPGGIGRFYNISSGADRRLIVKPGEPGKFRMDIGLHPENAFAGSAGCPVLLHDTPQRRQGVLTLFDALGDLKAQGLNRIRLLSFVGERDS